MGSYLNPGNKGFQESLNSEIYVDKTGLIEKTNEVLDTRQKFLCVSRPRRFGKSMAADMLAAYYERGEDSAELFGTLKISKVESYEKNRNQYDIIKVNMQEFLSMTHSMDEMLSMLQKYLIFDLTDHFDNVRFRDENNLIQVMKDIYSKTKHSFVILIDEWDCLFREYQQDQEAQRKGKQIIPTAEGRELIRVMPENLKSAGLTAEWENRLLLMERGELNGEQFMDDIVTMLEEILNGCRKIPEEERNRFQTAKELIGKCPVCGSDIFEGKRNFYCSNRQCDFALWKDNRFLEGMEKKLDKKMAKELLDKACTHVKGLYSKKKDSRFDADLLMTLENGKPKFHLEFPKRKHKG